MKRLGYIRSGWLPTRQVNGLQTVRMCEAFARLGLETVLYYIPHPVLREDVRKYYDVRQPIHFKRLPRAVLPIRKHFYPERWVNFPGFGHALLWSYAAVMIAKRSRADLYFTRDGNLAWWLGKMGLPTVLEVHNIADSRVQRALQRRASKFESVKLVVCVSDRLRQDLIEKVGVSAKKTIRLRNGVEVERFRLSLSKKDCRQELQLPLDSPLVTYAGKLFPEKGVEILIRAAPRLGGAKIVIVGFEGDMARLSALIKEVDARNIILVEYVQPDRVPLYLKAADLLVLPNSAKNEESKLYTSPVKLFEYMASGVPVVASDLPSVREVLHHGENGWLAQPDDPLALARGIHFILGNPELAGKLADQAWRDVQDHTCERRASRILERALSVP